MQAFLNRLMDAAGKAGLTACEAYVVESDSFEAGSTEGEIIEYNSNTTRALGFRGIYKGRMGYASTEAFDGEAVDQLVKGVLESAELNEDPDEVFLYDGAGEAPEINLQNPELAQISPQEKINRLLTMEKLIKTADPRIDKTAYNGIYNVHSTVRILNSHGMNRCYTEDACGLSGNASAKEGDSITTGGFAVNARSFDKLDAEKIATETVRRTVEGLNAKPVPSGKYRVVLFNEAMTSLLGVFSGIFSAEVAQKGLSLLAGKAGQQIAAPCINLIDDPLLPDGMASRPFDAEGVPSSAHTVVENGVFQTFLYDLKTAHKDGVATTGNASRASAASSVHVAPSNFYLKPGGKSFDALLEGMGEGIVITEVSGLHAGANPVSGDFSLLSKGYIFRNGKRDKAVEQITIAGNFYELLKSVQELANDLAFPRGGIGSPSVDVGELSISGC
ncbi:MAG: TldD/PmbA family protein [Clostridiales bacterium]|nr:TldD/PmbA family protein [Clostridiales bacterium]